MSPNSSCSRKMNLQIVCPQTKVTVWTPSYVSDDSLSASRVLSDFEEEPEVLGKGSFGVVTRVRSKIDDQYYALKKVMLECGNGYEEATREVIAMARISHSNVVRYHTSWLEEGPAGVGVGAIKGRLISVEVGQVNGPMICIQMELCFGTLHELMYKKELKDDQLLKFCKQIVEAVQYLHTLDMMHGDLSPRNIFLTKSGDAIKIGDFGHARIPGKGMFNDDEYSPMSIYTAPESEGLVDRELLETTDIVRRNVSTYSLKSDIYSLGMTMMEMFGRFSDKIAGENALIDFVAKKIIPAPLQSYPVILGLVEQMTSSKPEERPTTSEILHLLNQVSWTV